ELLRLQEGVRLREGDVRRFAARCARNGGDVELRAEGRLDVALVVNVLFGEGVLQLRQQLVVDRKPVEQPVELLPAARAEVAVDRRVRERLRADELGSGAADPAAGLARGRAAAACDTEKSGENGSQGQEPTRSMAHAPTLAQDSASVKIFGISCQFPDVSHTPFPSEPLCSFCRELPITGVRHVCEEAEM